MAPEPPTSLEAALAALVEPWMDVLLVGLSPEVLAEAPAPGRLTTVRLGGSVPAGPWDVALVRVEPGRLEPARRALDAVAPDVRQGGLIGLIALGSHGEGEAEAMASLLRRHGAGGTDDRPCTADGRLLLCRKTSPGVNDLVGLRRCLRALETAVERLESLVAEVRDRDAGPRPGGPVPTLKELIGRLGDLDRDRFFPLVRHAVEGDGEPPPLPDLDAVARERDHDARLLVELVARFRHFRHLSLDVLHRLGERDWLRPATAPDGSETTAAELVRLWFREEAQLLATIEARLRE